MPPRTCEGGDKSSAHWGGGSPSPACLLQKSVKNRAVTTEKIFWHFVIGNSYSPRPCASAGTPPSQVRGASTRTMSKRVPWNDTEQVREKATTQIQSTACPPALPPIPSGAGQKRLHTSCARLGRPPCGQIPIRQALPMGEAFLITAPPDGVLPFSEKRCASWTGWTGRRPEWSEYPPRAGRRRCPKCPAGRAESG